tara:strand:+ start:203 stop:463 length:261 start_codon:yes stop_codon:yes gene_type:complete
LFEIGMRILVFVLIAIFVAISCGVFVSSTTGSSEGKYIGSTILFVACSGWAYFTSLVSYGVYMIVKRSKQNHDLKKEGQLICKIKH